MAVTRWRKSALCLALLAGLSACTGQSVRPDDPEDIYAGGRFEPWSDARPAYRIGEGDHIKVMFPLTPELDEDALVRPDGVVTLRAAGEVNLASLPTEEASAVVAKAASRRLKDPRVQIAVTDAVSAKIYVGGEVHLPGAYSLTGSMTVIGALQAASGASDMARLDEVILIRRAPDNRPMIRTVDVRAGLEGRGDALIRLAQGDIIFVPKSRIAEFDLWIDQFVNRAIPFSRNFDYSIGQSTTTTIAH